MFHLAEKRKATGHAKPSSSPPDSLSREPSHPASDSPSLTEPSGVGINHIGNWPIVFCQREGEDSLPAVHCSLIAGEREGEAAASSSFLDEGDVQALEHALRGAKPPPPW